MITLTKTINKLPENPLLKTNKWEHRFEMNIKTRTGNHQQASPQLHPFLHFLGAGVGNRKLKRLWGTGPDALLDSHLHANKHEQQNHNQKTHLPSLADELLWNGFTFGVGGLV
ncbi:MAG: hypothetical protein NXI08_17220 [bacterium]|nr:hypothetical protein [bacterium]